MKNIRTILLEQLMKQHGYRQSSPIKMDDSTRFNGILSDRTGKKYFVKATFGKKSYAYKSLYRESQVTNYLSVLAKKANIKHDGFKLYIPAVAEIIEQGEFFCFITNYIEGIKLSNESTNTQADILLITSDLVNKLSKKTHKSTIMPYLKNYTPEAILFSLPIRFIKAAILSPFAFSGLVRAFLKSLALFSSGTKKRGLVHPDINSNNIIFRKNDIYLTDWEEAGWGISEYNKITPLCVHWQDLGLRDALLRKLLEKGQQKMYTPLLAYRTLMLLNQRMKKGSKKRKRDFMLLKYLES